MKYELTAPPENASEQYLFRETGWNMELGNPVTEQAEGLIGDPEDTENWHFQAEQTSCVIAIEEMIAEQLLGKDLPEGKLIEYSRKSGWYEPGRGTSLEDTGKILERLGLEVERGDNWTVSHLIEALAQGKKILCAVDGMMLLEPRLAEIPGRTANHAVQLVGIDFSNPENVQVILNDTFDPNGKGVRYDMDLFLAAWKTGGNFAVMADKGGTL